MVGEFDIANEHDLIAEARRLCFAEPHRALEVCKQLPINTPTRNAQRYTLEAMIHEALDDDAAAEGSWAQVRHHLPKIEVIHERCHIELLPARIYWQHGLNQRALDWAIRVREQAHQQHDTALEASALTSIGELLNVFDEYTQALSMLLQALPLHQQVGNIYGACETHFMIASVYNNQGMNEKSFQHLEEATQFAFQTKDLALQSRCIKTLADANAKCFKRFDRADELMRQALKIATAEGNAITLGEVYLSMGRIEVYRGQNARAIEHMERALSMLEHRSGVERLTDVRLGIVRTRLETGDTGPRTLELLQRCLKDATVGGTKMYEGEAYLLHAQYFEQTGDYASALQHMKHGRTIEQELSEERAERRFHQLAIQFDLERAEARANHEREHRERLEAVNRENARLLEQLQAQTLRFEHLAMRDPLTGLYNRRAMNAHLEAAFTQARTSERDLCMAVVDVDHFKTINDRYSHATGDEVLRTLAIIFSEHMQASDLIARAGGEEFVFAFHDCPLPIVLLSCEQLRQRVQDHDWAQVSPGLQVRVSIGVTDNSNAGSFSEMLSQADRNLYRAKETGRNRVC